MHTSIKETVTEVTIPASTKTIKEFVCAKCGYREQHVSDVEKHYAFTHAVMFMIDRSMSDAHKTLYKFANGEDALLFMQYHLPFKKMSVMVRR